MVNNLQRAEKFLKNVAFARPQNYGPNLSCCVVLNCPKFCEQLAFKVLI